MPCHAAMIEKCLSVSGDEEIEKVLKKMKKAKVNTVAVVDKNGMLEGVLSSQSLFQNILPVNISMSNSASMMVSSAPGLAKRLRKVMVLPVKQIMDRKPLIVYPETPIWEGVKLLMEHNKPIMVVDHETQKFIWVMDFDSALDELIRLQEGKI